MDSRGGIYLIAEFGRELEIGGEVLVSEGLTSDVLIAAYDADGTFRWVLQLSSPGADLANDITYSADADLIYASAHCGSASDDFGGAVVPEASPVLFAIRPDGAIAWSRLGTGSSSLGTSGGAVVLIDGSTIRAISAEAETLWTTTLSDGVSIQDTDSTTSHHYFVGRATEDTVNLGLGDHVRHPSSGRDMFVLRTTLDGTPDREYWSDIRGSSVLERMAVRPDGSVAVVLRQVGLADYGTGEVIGDTQSMALVGLDASLTAVDARIIVGDARPLAIATTSAGVIRIAGGFFGSVNFGSGTRSAVGIARSGSGMPPFYAFIADFESDLRPREDQVLAPSGPGLDCDAEACGSVASAMAVGPADSTVVGGHFFPSIDLGSGTRFSAPEDEDGFVLRLAN
ncbi:MAG: hypothetical protein AB8I08_06630 [Sandaracinaceae bacterium]